MPRDVPPVNLVEMRVSGADVLLVDGLIDEAGRVLHERAATAGWFELNTLKEPYRQEGKKTLGFELAEQGGWGDQCLPDVIVFPTGGGTGIVGLWKAFAELGELDRRLDCPLSLFERFALDSAREGPDDVVVEPQLVAARVSDRLLDQNQSEPRLGLLVLVLVLVLILILILVVAGRGRGRGLGGDFDLITDAGGGELDVGPLLRFEGRLDHTAIILVLALGALHRSA